MGHNSASTTGNAKRQLNITVKKVTVNPALKGINLKLDKLSQVTTNVEIANMATSNILDNYAWAVKERTANDSDSTVPAS